MGIVQIDMFLYVRIDVWEKMTKKEKTVPATGRRREHGLGRYLQVGRASKVKHVQQSAHREVDLISR